MFVVDLVVGAVVAVAVVTGFRRGLQGMLGLAGFAVGAVLGTRLPLLVGGHLGGHDGRSGFAVPNRFVREALRKAGPPVSTGHCNGDRFAR